MRSLSLLTLTGIGICGLASLAGGAPSVSSTSKETSYEDLESFGKAVKDLEEIKANKFIYEQRSRELIQLARTFEGKTVRFSAAVLSVTHEEVIITLEDAGKTRVVLRHSQPPFFGDLRTREYSGTPSTQRFHVFVRPVTLRVGSEIPLQLAQRLRHGNQLLLAGQISSMVVRIDPWHDPFVLAVITHGKVTGVTEGD